MPIIKILKIEIIRLYDFNSLKKALFFLLTLAFFSVSIASTPPVGGWSIVPFQQVSNRSFKLEVVAFHPDGVREVRFYLLDDNPEKAIVQKVADYENGYESYSVGIDLGALPQGRLQIDATIISNGGDEKKLDRFFLINRYKQKKESAIFVEKNGSDFSGTGEKSNPFQSINKALEQKNLSGEIVILSGGEYCIESSINKINTESWIIIRGADSGLASPVVITSNQRSVYRSRVNRLKFENVSIDFSKIQQIYTEVGAMVWFDKSRLFDSNGYQHRYDRNVPPVRTSVYSGGYYATDSIVEDMTYGFVDANLAKNVKIRRVSGDALQNSRMVLNAEIESMNGHWKPEIHSDIFQYYGNFDNVYVQNVKAGRLYYIQNFFLDHKLSKFSNMVFRDICISNEAGDPPFSQLNSKSENIYFVNVRTYGQSWVLRDDMKNGEEFIPKNVIFYDGYIPRLRMGKKGSVGLNSEVKVIKKNKFLSEKGGRFECN